MCIRDRYTASLYICIMLFHVRAMSVTGTAATASRASREMNTGHKNDLGSNINSLLPVFELPFFFIPLCTVTRFSIEMKSVVQCENDELSLLTRRKRLQDLALLK